VYLYEYFEDTNTGFNSTGERAPIDGVGEQILLLYKVVEGLVPAIKPEDYQTKSRQGRTIKPKRFDDYVNTNIVENSVKNNTEQYRNSFLNKTICGTTWRKI
jgi:hypothetical protein